MCIIFHQKFRTFLETLIVAYVINNPCIPRSLFEACRQEVIGVIKLQIKGNFD